MSDKVKGSWKAGVTVQGREEIEVDLDAFVRENVGKDLGPELNAAVIAAAVMLERGMDTFSILGLDNGKLPDHVPL